MIDPHDLETIEAFNAAWAAGDLEAVFECTDPGMEFDWSESISPFKGIYKGRDGLRAFHAELQETFDDFRPEYGDPVDCGNDRIATPTTVFGKARTGGIELEARGAMVWVVRDSKILRAKLFQNLDDALAATGCSG